MKPPVHVSDELALARVVAAFAGETPDGPGPLTDRDSRLLYDKIRAAYPQTGAQVRGYRRFHSLTAAQAAGNGTRGLILAGAGLPAGPHLHEAALAASPDVRCLYAEPCEEAVLSRRAASGPRCASVLCAADDPAKAMAAAEEEGMEGPFQAHLVMTTTCQPDDEAAEAAARWARALPPGSSVALSAGTGGEDGRPGDLLAGIATVYPHSVKSVRAWLERAGLDVLEPGVVPVIRWPLGTECERAGWRVCGAVAVKR